MTIGVDASVIVITDCGSTTTKAILIEEVDGVFRQTSRGEAPTTVEAPVEDVTRGVIAALRDLSALSGRRIIDDDGEIIRPARGNTGVDLYLSTSSAGGGLQMMVAGVVGRISARSAERAALGAGAIVADVIACDDERSPQRRIDRLKGLRPDMVLLAGGTDGGAEVGVVEMAEMLSAADPKPRFGKGFRLPVIFAGNPEVANEVRRIVGGKSDLFVVDNLRPTVDEEKIGPAREKIHDLFLEHVMQQAPGFARLVEWTDSPVMPTPSAVGSMLRSLADTEDIAVLCVDIGGATTDIFSVVEGAFNRTVSANLGVSYSAAFVLRESGEENLERWLPFEMDPGRLRDEVMNKTIRPTTIPDSEEGLLVEQALAREALRISLEQHRAFATGLKGTMGKSSGISGFSDGSERDSLVQMASLGLIIGSGGVLSHAPRPAQTAAMLIDAFAPEGITRIAKDSIFMLPHLGVLAEVNGDAARSVLARDCVVDLCTCVAPSGVGKSGSECLEFSLEMDGSVVESGRLAVGDVLVVPLPEGREATLTVSPRRGFDVGEGKGRRWSGPVKGGPCGLVFDCRGRPIAWPGSRAERVAAMRRWRKAFGAIDEADKEDAK